MRLQVGALALPSPLLFTLDLFGQLSSSFLFFSFPFSPLAESVGMIGMQLQ